MWPDAPGDDASAYNKVFLMSDGHVTFFFFFKKKVALVVMESHHSAYY